MAANLGDFYRLLIMLALVSSLLWFGALPSATAQGRGNGGGSSSGGWIEQFDDANIGTRSWGGWSIEQTGPNARFGIPGVGLSGKSFEAFNVSFFPGIVSLKLSISSDLYSSGALLYSNGTFGFGTYDYCARMSSTATSPGATSSDPSLHKPPSGGVSAGFTYVGDSYTEIDFEQAYAKDTSGILRLWLYMGNWRNLNPWHTAVLADPYLNTPALRRPYDGFKIYKFVWTRKSIDFYVDGVRLATHTQNVPTAPAHVMLNHWGTNSPDGFGGKAEPGPRYFYVDWVRYTPSGNPVNIPCGP